MKETQTWWEPWRDRAGVAVASLNAQQMRWLLDLCRPAGWRRHRRVAARYRPYREGLPVRRDGARNGVNAALVVHAGWTGVNDVLSGPNNFVETYNPKADPAG